jgi:hypothetical protein
MSGPLPYPQSEVMLTTFTSSTGPHDQGDSTMYPRHTGSVLLDVASAQRNELLATAHSRRRARLARDPSITTRPDVAPKRHWWWGLARHHHAA